MAVHFVRDMGRQMTRPRWAMPAALGMALLVCASLRGQTFPGAVLGAGSAAISGVVVDGVTGKPLAGAVVLLGSPSAVIGTAPLRQVTDDKGRFVFVNLMPSSEGYGLVASRFGYVADDAAGRGVSTLRVPLGDGGWFGDATLTLFPLSSLAGRVLDDDGEPVVGAYVRVLAQVNVAGRPHFAAGPVARSDDRGVYRVANLPPGRYVVNIPSVQMAVTPELAATPSILGAPPEPTLEISDTLRLLLGRYPMPRPLPNGAIRVYAPTFFPVGRTPHDAQLVELGHGDARTGLDLQLRAVPAVRVSGTVSGPMNAIKGLRLRLVDRGAEELGDASETATTMVGPDGSFTFVNVPQGPYTLLARWATAELAIQSAPGSLQLPAAPRALVLNTLPGVEGMVEHYRSLSSSDQNYWGRAQIEVGDRDVSGVIVSMQPGTSISGRGVVETSAGIVPVTSPPIGVFVIADPVDGDISLVAPSESTMAPPADPATFIARGLAPGRYLLRFRNQPGNLKSIVWNGRDMTDVPFDTSAGIDFTNVEVTFTDKKAAVIGTVRDAQGRPIPDAAIIAFPTDREQWTNYGLRPRRLHVVASGADGSFDHSALPAGEYFLAALRASDVTDWRTLAFLSRVAPLATRIVLTWGEPKTLDLMLVRVQRP